MSLVELKQAAEMLGVTPEELNQMRARNEIAAYRDGTTWKFKEEELQRVLDLRQAQDDMGEGSAIRLDEAIVSGGSDVDSDLDVLIDIGDSQLGDALRSDSVLDDRNAKQDPTASSTVVGKKQLLAGGEVLDVGEEPGAQSSAEETSVRLQDSNDLFDVDDDLLGGSSELKLAADSSVASGGGELDAGDTGALGKGADLDDDLILDSGVSLDLGDEDLQIDLGSSSELRLEGGSELRLAASDTGVSIQADEDIELDFSASDISLDPSKSGITLESPSDSGISLEQTPPELTIGGDSLELGEAELLDLDDGFADFDDATTMQRDQDFLLTPVEGDLADESDSGSQVIQLDSEEFDDSAATVLGADHVAIVDERGGGPELPSDGLIGVPTGMYAPEANYTILNVLSLGLVLLPLAMAGVMMFDVIRHMWSWDEPYTLNSSLIDAITGLFGR